MEKTYQVPNVVWIRVTDYMQGWLGHTLAGEARIGEQRVVSVSHLPGAKEVWKMETRRDTKDAGTVYMAMSAQRRNLIATGLQLDEKMVNNVYGLTREGLEMFIPVECPSLCVNAEGVMRPWKPNVCTGREQTNALLRVIRQAFWQAVEDYDRQYALQLKGKKYAAMDMIEAWCNDTDTPDTYADAMRREWQRRQKRTTQKSSSTEKNTSEKSVPISQLI